MVERLKIAVEKARAQRQGAAAAITPPEGSVARATGTVGAPLPTAPAAVVAAPVTTPNVQESPEAAPPQPVPADDAQRAAAWNTLEAVELDPKQLAQNRIITHERQDHEHIAFDVLRTRLLRAFGKHGWTRLGITSPHQNCGKTFVAANLALSLARQADCRTILMDMDLRNPSIANTLGLKKLSPEPARWFLSGEVTPQKYLRRYGANLALGLSSGRMRDSAELILQPSTGRALDAMRTQFTPDLVIYDLPPMLSCDDALGFLPQLDAVLLVIGGGKTKPAEVSECERLLQDQCPLLGVILNKAEGVSAKQYKYY